MQLHDPALVVEEVESAQQPVQQQQAASKYRPAGQDWFKCA